MKKLEDTEDGFVISDGGAKRSRARGARGAAARAESEEGRGGGIVTTGEGAEVGA